MLEPDIGGVTSGGECGFLLRAVERGEGIVVDVDADASFEGGVHIKVGGNAVDLLGALMELGIPATTYRISMSWEWSAGWLGYSPAEKVQQRPHVIGDRDRKHDPWS